MVSSIQSPANRHHETDRLSESRGTSSHDFTLTNELSVKFASIEGEVDVEIDTVKRPLGSIHPFEVFLEILSRKIRCKGDNFLDTWILGIFGTDIFVASVQDVLIHQCCSRCDLAEETNFDRLTDLDAFAFLYEYLTGILASVLTI
jgi:hypothetical protein